MKNIKIAVRKCRDLIDGCKLLKMEMNIMTLFQANLTHR